MPHKTEKENGMDDLATRIADLNGSIEYLAAQMSDETLSSSDRFDLEDDLIDLLSIGRIFQRCVRNLRKVQSRNTEKENVADDTAATIWDAISEGDTVIVEGVKRTVLHAQKTLTVGSRWTHFTFTDGFRLQVRSTWTVDRINLESNR